MAAVVEERIDSFQSFVGCIERLQHAAKKSLWYRGTNKTSHTLLPTLYRHSSAKRASDIAKLEEHLMLRFRQRSIPFVNRQLGDNWDTLFVMQHYGVPTRLLDWSENPFISLFFALTGRNFTVKIGRGAPETRELNFSDDAAVWVLDPIIWNRHALRHQSFKGEIPFSDDPAVTPYRSPLDHHDSRNLPLAINGAHNSARIVAQRGAFTIFGDNVSPIETSFDIEGFPEASLRKLVLPRELIPQLRKGILNHGFTESGVFPDLDGLAREMRREFEFED